MLHFRFLSFPIQVHWSFWLGAVAFFPFHNFQFPLVLGMVLMWAFIVGISVLWHEMGHAYYQRKYGAYVDIFLHAFGGLSMGTLGQEISRRNSLIIVAAGPIAQGLLAAAIWLLIKAFPESTTALPVNYTTFDLVRVLFWKSFLLINVALPLLNLVPCYPLDGGQFLYYLTHRNGKITGVVGMVVGPVAAVCLPLFLGFSVIACFFFLYFTYTSYRLYAGHRFGDWRPTRGW